MEKIHLLKKISEINGISERPLVGMIYGSKNKNSDLDIFLIYESPLKKNIFQENLDLNQIDIKNFKRKIYLRDIEYTEPILTGEIFFGNPKIIKNSKKFLQENDPSEIIYDYLEKRSIETFLQANTFYSRGKEEIFIKTIMKNSNSKEVKKKIFENNLKFNSEILNKSLSTLTYSLSYLSSINRYKTGKKIITLKEIINNPINRIEQSFSNLRKYFKECSKKNDHLSFKKIDSYFEETKYLLNKFI